MLKSLGLIFRKFARPIWLPVALRQLQGEVAGFKTADDAVERAFEPRSLSLNLVPLQVREEITEFVKLLQERPPATVLEIGTECGGTLFMLACVSAPDALVISLDLPTGQFNAYPAWREKLYRGFARDRQKVEIVRADSHAASTVEKIRTLLAGRSLDLLFIDGDHSYDGVKKDFEMYSPLVAPDGIIAFHDIVDGPESAVGGVPRFWRELKPTRLHREIVKSWQQGGYGIGVLPPVTATQAVPVV